MRTQDQGFDVIDALLQMIKLVANCRKRRALQNQHRHAAGTFVARAYLGLAQA